ncbi:MAG: hypothetical protein OK456_00700 [Thaumarchaeota archaeon]|nr:hypothetical protein [Nitrososphaerota archaeon]
METPVEDASVPVQDSKQLNSDMALMVKEISKIGPKIPEIARRMGRHKETVRYWYKKLQEHDFAIQGITNHEAFGLQRILLKVSFGDDYAQYVRPLMFTMNELCYVVSYAKALAEECYTVNCSVPRELVGEYLTFVDELRQMGVFKKVEVFNLGWIRNIPMHGEYYDFNSGRWDFDLEGQAEKESTFQAPTVSEKVKFDKIDLLITKELVTDATRELQEIQASIKKTDGVDINYKTLCWHLKEHVMGQGMLKGFRINWMGSRWDPVADRAKHKSHSYVAIHFMVKNPTDAERKDLMRSFDRLPVVWAEGAGYDYFSEFIVPTEMMLDCMEYLERVMKPVRDRASYHIMDQRNAVAFALTYQLYDEESKIWKFNREELLAKFKVLEAQVRVSG